LLSLLIFHATDSAFAQTYRTFTVTPVPGSGTNPHAATDDNGYIYVTYENGTTSVAFTKSTNNGTSFSTAVNVGTGFGYFPRIAIDNAQEAYVVYTFQAGSNYWPRGFIGISPGYSFSKIVDETKLSGSQGAQSVSHSDISIENVSGTNEISVVWEDNDTDVSDQWYIWFAGEYDDDDDFTEPTEVAISNNPATRYPVLATKKSEEDHVYAAWVHLGEHIMFDYSETTGHASGTWNATDIQISDDADVVVGQRPGLAASEVSGTTWVFAMWTDSRKGNNDVYFDYENDTGELTTSTWNTDKGPDAALGEHIVNPSYAAYGQDQPSIAVKPGSTNLYAVWRDTRDETNHIYFQEGKWQSGAFVWGIDKDANGTIAGTAEVGEDMRVSTTASGNEETPTVLANGSDEVYVIWCEAGAGIKCARYGPGPGVDAPSAPTNLTAVAGDAKVNLDWDDNTEADFSSYNIYRSTTRGQWNFLASSGASEYEDGSLTNGICYWYVVTAVDTEEFESNYSNDAHATPNIDDTTAPAAPTGLTATAGSLQVSLSWTVSTSTDVSGYHVYRSTVSGSGYSYCLWCKFSTTFYTDTGLVAGVKYYYVVTAVDTSNNESSDSNEANAAPLDESGQVVSPPAEFPAGPGLLRT
jgi:hypothetical protein